MYEEEWHRQMADLNKDLSGRSKYAVGDCLLPREYAVVTHAGFNWEIGPSHSEFVTNSPTKDMVKQCGTVVQVWSDCDEGTPNGYTIQHPDGTQTAHSEKDLVKFRVTYDLR